MPAYVDGDRAEQRIVEASVVMPLGAGITGWASLRWYGAVWFDGYAPDGATQLPIRILTGDRNIRSQPGFVVVEERLLPTDLTVVDGVVTTDPVRSLTHEMRYATSMREASVAFSMAAYSDLVTAHEICAHGLEHPGWTGAPQLREASAFLEENSWSPWEQRTSLVWQIDAELPKPMANRPIFDRYGNHLGTPDLLDEVAGVVMEYDGGVHLAPGREVIDATRLERFRNVGLECLTVRRGETTFRESLAGRMRATRERAQFAAPSRRHWTTELPRWWIPTFTVEERRNLGESERVALLRLRRKIS
ncbi:MULTISPECIES: hypothetical protein [unclassified Nocardioides]|uniref:hypothetical protein n=1 Tax=unclassified Nocardioides TaxID=2615069 RepID=UPI0006F5E2EB|nr:MULTISPECIES: hypothetical protein [unclassified Nocardioides]KQY56958.1 hypothetical protein ASD30_11825 [Nocardioides sp. Root140]KQZ66842.1 hypothetical protein ASD66_17615 [Nocardioides sp. Root151]KRF13079.1 hypothetical protein ASH02_16470 [Nocardioides sp. Soil796]